MFLITATPRTGKSTLIKKLVDEIGRDNLCGFFTEEILENGERVGFKIKEISGKEFVLAHVDFKSDYKVSKYHVDLKTFEKFVVSFFSKIDVNKVLVIDEIGPMQALSPVFRKQITRLFNLPVAIFGTIFLGSHTWLDEIKKSDKIDLINITVDNRDFIASSILRKIKDSVYSYRVINSELNKKEVKSEGYVKLVKEAIKNKNNEVIIKTEHGIRKIKEHPVLGISCTCDFYKKANTCSHIMAYKKTKFK